MKGVVTDDTLRVAGNELRSEGSRIGQPLELLFRIHKEGRENPEN
jgi:hypothetical protein